MRDPPPRLISTHPPAHTRPGWGSDSFPSRPANLDASRILRVAVHKGHRDSPQAGPAPGPPVGSTPHSKNYPAMSPDTAITALQGLTAELTGKVPVGPILQGPPRRSAQRARSVLSCPAPWGPLEATVHRAAQLAWAPLASRGWRCVRDIHHKPALHRAHPWPPPHICWISPAVSPEAAYLSPPGAHR